MLCKVTGLTAILCTAEQKDLTRTVTVYVVVHLTDRAVNKIPAFSVWNLMSFLTKSVSLESIFVMALKQIFFWGEVYILFPRALRYVTYSLTVLCSLSCSFRVLQWNLALCKSRHWRRRYLRGRRSICSVRPGARYRLLASYGCWMASS